MPVIPEWKRPAQPSLVLRLWDGNAVRPAVYVATPNPAGPGYLTRRYTREDAE